MLDITKDHDYFWEIRAMIKELLVCSVALGIGATSRMLINDAIEDKSFANLSKPLQYGACLALILSPTIVMGLVGAAGYGLGHIIKASGLKLSPQLLGSCINYGLTAASAIMLATQYCLNSKFSSIDDKPMIIFSIGAFSAACLGCSKVFNR